MYSVAILSFAIFTYCAAFSIFSFTIFTYCATFAIATTRRFFRCPFYLCHFLPPFLPFHYHGAPPCLSYWWACFAPAIATARSFALGWSNCYRLRPWANIEGSLCMDSMAFTTTSSLCARSQGSHVSACGTLCVSYSKHCHSVWHSRYLDLWVEESRVIRHEEPPHC